MSAKILVVDDQAGPRESLRMILNHEHEVRTASRGSEALAMIREDQPDLVFLDIRMPEMDGTEVLRRIKEMAPECEVAMITAYAAVASAQRAIRLGALDYITKPFGVTEIEEVVERALARRREQKEERMLLEQLSGTIAQLSRQLSESPDRRSASDESIARGLASAHSSIEDQLNEVLRLSSIGEVAAEVAHDMNNFLSTILFRIEIMLLDLDQARMSIRGHSPTACNRSRSRPETVARRSIASRRSVAPTPMSQPRKLTLTRYCRARLNSARDASSRPTSTNSSSISPNCPPSTAVLRDCEPSSPT